MTSTFFGLEIGNRALTANQSALDVIGQNISNVNTPGYSRQVVNLVASDPFDPSSADATKPNQIGTGVSIASVDRVRDQFVNQRVYTANGDLGALNNLQDTLGRVEQAYNEPSTTGIGSQLQTLLNSFSDLSADPENSGIRSTVLNNGEALVNAFQSVNTSLNQINPELTAKISQQVDVVNSTATQIAALNQQIGVSVASGNQPNDLLDTRDQLLNTLSSLVNVQVINSQNPQTGQPNGEVQINVGGFTLVSGESANAVPSTPTSTNGNLGLVDAQGNVIPLQGGEVYGLIKATSLVSGYQTDLNNLARNVIDAVNTQHALGYGLDGQTGRAFFAGTDAASIAVSGTVEGDLNAIAAAGAPGPGGTVSAGNGDNATALAALSTAPVIGTQSLDDYYNARIGVIGADSKSYQDQAANQQQVVTQLQNLQSSVSGVSLDEELTRMMQFQRAYQAAARVINTMDATTSLIINGLVTPAAGG